MRDEPCEPTVPTPKYVTFGRSYGDDIITAVREMQKINSEANGPLVCIFRVSEQNGLRVLHELPFDCKEIADAERAIEQEREAHRKHLQNIGVLKTDAELAAIREADRKNAGHGLWLCGKRDFEQPGFERHKLDDTP
jgi:hypothetical protein